MVARKVPRLDRAIEFDDAAHYRDSPSHGSAVLSQIRGEINRLCLLTETDVVLYAYHVSDALPRILGYLKELVIWSNMIIEASPDEVGEAKVKSVC